ncbi:MAG: GspE/PulE family protein [Microthrixaceae bacterium]
MLKRTRRTGKDKTVDFSASSEHLETEIQEWVAEERRKMGEILLDAGIIDAEQLLDALQSQQETGRRLGEILLDRGQVDEHQLAGVLAEQFHIDRADLRLMDPDPVAVARVTEELARKHKVIPLYVDEESRVSLVTGEPLGVDAIRELTQHCHRIRIMVGSTSDIERMLDQAYNALSLADEHIQAFNLIADEDESTSEAINLEVDENAPIVQVVNRILIQAARARASDVHIEPHEHQVVVRFRIDGALSVAIQLPRRMGAPVSSRLKVMSDLNIVERRRPQDGQFSVNVDGRPIDVRISVVGTVHGEKIVLRLLDKTRSLISLNHLGISPKILPDFIEIVKAPLGMLLCTGPTGSGKTTTLYATLTEVQDPTKNVVTIEDPVEYQFPGINQMPISEAAGISFADGLRGILRQDPDTILVGEIRDVETARIATQAALTGHFVLSSLHAVDSVSAIHRFTDMGIEPFLVASAVSGVVGQRLLRRICTSCRETYEPHPDHIRLTQGFAGKLPDAWTRGAGCNMCSGTGYAGRVGVYELLKVSDAIRNLIVAKATAKEIRDVAVAEGMSTMQTEAFGLVAAGVTTVDDVLRSVYAPGMEGDLLDIDEVEGIDLTEVEPEAVSDGGMVDGGIVDVTERERVAVAAESFPAEPAPFDPAAFEQSAPAPIVVDPAAAYIDVTGTVAQAPVANGQVNGHVAPNGNGHMPPPAPTVHSNGVVNGEGLPPAPLFTPPVPAQEVVE